MPDRRAFPAAVFVPEKIMKSIAEQSAQLSEKERQSRRVILVRVGRYRANTDQVAPYNNESNLPRPYPKADLEKAKIVRVKDILDADRALMGAPKSDKSFLSWLREYWDESIEPDTVVTLVVCRNLNGSLIDYYSARNMEKWISLRGMGKE